MANSHIREVFILKLLFIFVSTLLILIIAAAKYFIFRCKNQKFLSRCGFVVGTLFALYSIIALILMFYTSSLGERFILLLLALSPYVIGKLTRYENLSISSILQMMFLVIGILFVMEN